jgi:inner membrane protein
MLARSGLDRKVVRAAPMMMIAANLPDIDAVAFFGGPAFYLEWHRSYAHALAFAPLMALIPPLLFLLFGRTKITLWSYAASLLGVLSHLLLDWTNIYGIRLLLPFSARWFHLDMTDIVDPWILAVLFLALAAPAMARMVGSEIASRKMKTGPQRGWAWFALIALIAYEGGRYTAHERALAVMSAHLFNGVIAKRLSVLPRGTTPFTWKGVAEGSSPDTGSFATIVPIDLNEPFDSTAGRIDYDALPISGTNPAIEAARATHSFRVFADFDQLPFWKVTPSADGTFVELIDLRFGSPQHPGFEASATVDSVGGVHDSRARFGR